MIPYVADYTYMESNSVERIMDMKYGVKVLFTYSVAPDDRVFYEEAVYCVEGESFEDAYAKAEKYANSYDKEHINPKGQKVKTIKIDFCDCFLSVEEEDDVQEIYSSIFMNKSALPEDAFYAAITEQCATEELVDLRYLEFNGITDGE